MITAFDWAAETSVIIPHPAEFITGLICFAVLLIVSHKIVAPRLEAMLAQRQAATEGGMEKAERVQAEARAALEEYRDQLASAREEAARIREEARTEGAKMIAEAREDAAADADRIIQDSSDRIAAQRAAARETLHLELGALSVDLASKIVGEDVSEAARRSRIVDDFIADWEKAR
ncbi:F0F1 ATP synthase subunit B [Streptomyces sp. NP160]|uniref:F0F1 ATP synthase subunit B n=1 Tax=Streptomyces sp. NP160 TaxID=2586637 RepID=UPI001C572909|nr:F0F1 ATP synthase subunit B [Streptomyces sp. NP160]